MTLRAPSTAYAITGQYTTVRTQSAGHPIRTVVSHRQPSRKGQVSGPQGTTPQVTDLARY